MKIWGIICLFTGICFAMFGLYVFIANIIGWPIDQTFITLGVVMAYLEGARYMWKGTKYDAS